MGNVLFHGIAAAVFAALVIPVIINALLVVFAAAFLIWASTEISGLFYAIVATISRERVSENKVVATGGAKIPFKMAADALRYTIKNVN